MKKAIIIILVTIIVGLLVGLLMAFPIMWLWNFIIPTIFGLPTITWTQAWALYVLCGMLFKSTNTTPTKD